MSTISRHTSKTACDDNGACMKLNVTQTARFVLIDGDQQPRKVCSAASSQCTKCVTLISVVGFV